MPKPSAQERIEAERTRNPERVAKDEEEARKLRQTRAEPQPPPLDIITEPKKKVLVDRRPIEIERAISGPVVQEKERPEGSGKFSIQEITQGFRKL